MRIQLPSRSRVVCAIEALIPLALAPATLANALAERFAGAPLFQAPCLITLVTGHRCPGCGLTRALTQLWSGHWKQAVALNMLSPFVFALLLTLFCLQLRIVVISQRKLFTTHISSQVDPGAAGKRMPGGLWRSSV